MPLRFVFGVHNHQPVGNFGFVFEQNYRDSYLPFLELVERFPRLAFTFHISGPLLDWLVEHRPEYVTRLRQRIAAGQVELLGGAYAEPILTMLPRRDRQGQIRHYSQVLHDRFGTRVRGMWLAERVWEPDLAGDLADAGIEYTLLDDYHFKQAGLEDDQLFGSYLSEDQGRLVRVFPISEPLRYLIPWKKPQEAVEYLLELAETEPDAIVVCADDGEKFGGWQGTHQLCYKDGWLREFFTGLMEHADTIQTLTLGQAAAAPPLGTFYLPDCSYREMTEWSLPVARLSVYSELVEVIDELPEAARIKRFIRGGFWRNFRVKYPEINEMYARMLEVSKAVATAREHGQPGAEAAEHALYLAQCNCAYWHGAFGGVYLPHLRNAVFHHLIDAENRLRLDSSSVAVADFDLDSFAEIKVSTPHWVAYLAPHRGGSLYELDLRHVRHNLLATLARRPEPYHDVIRKKMRKVVGSTDVVLTEQTTRAKHDKLEQHLVYDDDLRKCLLDHFYPVGTSMKDVVTLQAAELGDFTEGGYDHHIGHDERGTTVTMTRAGTVADWPVEVRKVVFFPHTSDAISIRYTLRNLPPQVQFLFAVEFNFAGLAANQPDRYYHRGDGQPVEPLQTPLGWRHVRQMGLADQWLGVDVVLTAHRPTDFWAFPIQTVSQSESGYDLVHQGNALFPHWTVAGEGNSPWEVELTLAISQRRAP